MDDLIKEGIIPNTEKENGDAGDDDDSVVETHPDFFVVTPLQTLKVNTALDGNDSMLSHYEFLGRVLGKAIYGECSPRILFCQQNFTQLIWAKLPPYYRINLGGASVLSPLPQQASR